MKLTKCSNGHFYDADKFDTCPHCGNGASAQSKTQPVNNGGAQNASGQPTAKVPTPSEQGNTRDIHAPAPGSLGAAVDDVKKTVGIFNQKSKSGNEPVVGWLVCVEGEHYGEDFRIKMGRNFIGRAADMDIVLAKDGTVSRSKHSILVYEPKGNMFIVQPGDSKELSYLNDDVILSPQALKAYDVITLGASKLMFVPFCSESFTWADKED